MMSCCFFAIKVHRFFIESKQFSGIIKHITMCFMHFNFKQCKIDSCFLYALLFYYDFSVGA